MSRYIEKQKFVDILNAKADTALGTPKQVFFSVTNMVEILPDADVVEVRHGKWTKSSPYNRFMNCSVCGFGQSHTTFKYCPDCGAKMDGEKWSENEKS